MNSLVNTEKTINEILSHNLKIFAFVKIGQFKHINDLREKGILYLNTIQFFREAELNSEQKDIYEGIEEIRQLISIKIQFEDKSIFILNKSSGDIVGGQFRVSNESLSGNLFCLTAITNKFVEKNNFLHPKLKEFGDSILVIYDPIKFLDRLDSSLAKAKYKNDYKLVSYYNEKEYEGSLNIFCKRNQLEYQSEWRLFVDAKVNEPFKLEIGNLSDISEIYSIEFFNNLSFRKDGLYMGKSAAI